MTRKICLVLSVATADVRSFLHRNTPLLFEICDPGWAELLPLSSDILFLRKILVRGTLLESPVQHIIQVQ